MIDWWRHSRDNFILAWLQRKIRLSQYIPTAIAVGRLLIPICYSLLFNFFHSLIYKWWILNLKVVSTSHVWFNKPTRVCPIAVPPVTALAPMMCLLESANKIAFQPPRSRQANGFSFHLLILSSCSRQKKNANHLCLFVLYLSDKVHQNVWLHISVLIFYGSPIGYIILLLLEVVLWLVTKMLFPAEVVLCSQLEYQRIWEMGILLMNLIYNLVAIMLAVIPEVIMLAVCYPF